MAEPTPEQIGLLAADVIELNKRIESEYYHDDASNETQHGLKKTAVNGALNALRGHGMVRDGYPNFESFGFESQAFVDITLDLASDEDDALTEKDIRKAILEDPRVILIYTVFGEVDLRCKVVGFSPRDIEQSAMRIKALEGVSSSKTFMIIDETNPDQSHEAWRKRAAQLIRANAARVGDVVQRKRKGNTTT